MTALLEADGLWKAYRRGGRTVPAVCGVSLALHRGETLGLCGASGSGKSTLARLLLGLLTADAGTVRLEGQDVTAMGQKGRRLLWGAAQMIFQSPEGSFDPRLTLGESLAEGPRLRGASRAEAEALAEAMAARCGLAPELLRRYPWEVSGGECQRAAAARALAVRPKLLVCDEATSALDGDAREGLLALLADLRDREGLALLFISHDPAAVQALCGRVLIMDGGRIAEEGPAEVIFRAPQSEAGRRLAEGLF